MSTSERVIKHPVKKERNDSFSSKLNELKALVVQSPSEKLTQEQVVARAVELLTDEKMPAAVGQDAVSPGPGPAERKVLWKRKKRACMQTALAKLKKFITDNNMFYVGNLDRIVTVNTVIAYIRNGKKPILNPAHQFSSFEAALSAAQKDPSSAEIPLRDFLKLFKYPATTPQASSQTATKPSAEPSDGRKDAAEDPIVLTEL